MDGLLLGARLLLAAVFLLAGVGKLLDLEGSVAAARGFRLPARLAGPVGLALPVVEILTALLLLPATTAWPAAVAAAVLLLGFLAGMANSLRLGEAPDCHCFGQIHSEPVGPVTIGRNGVLLVVALFVVVEGYGDAGTSPFGALADLSAFETTLLAGLAVALAGVAAEGWFIAHLLKQSGRFLLAVDEIRAGVPAPPQAGGSAHLRRAPDVTVRDLDGRPFRVHELLERGRPVILVFSDPGCAPCAALRPEIHRWQTEHAGRVTLAVISRGDAATNRPHMQEHGIERVYLETERNASVAFGVTGTPAAVLIAADGAIDGAVAGGAAAIRALVARATKPPTIPLNGVARPPSPAVGKPAPAIELPDLDGETVAVNLSHGRETVVLFWNPACGYCRRMRPDLLAWEAEARPGAPDLLIVSTGSADANRAEGLRSPVLLDAGFTTGRRYGASGTPSAVLVDGKGTVASGVTVGGPAVMALLTGRATEAAATGTGAST